MDTHQNWQKRAKFRARNHFKKVHGSAFVQFFIFCYVSKSQSMWAVDLKWPRTGSGFNLGDLGHSPHYKSMRYQNTEKQRQQTLCGTIWHTISIIIFKQSPLFELFADSFLKFFRFPFIFLFQLFHPFLL